MHASVILVASVFALSQGQTLEKYGPLARENVFPPDWYLVRAVMVGPTAFRVLDVYAGPADLRHKTVTGDFSGVGDLLYRLNASKPPLNPGVEGVFWVRQSEKNEAPAYLGFFPNSVDVDPATTFAHAVRTCNALKEIYKATDQERLAVMDKYMKGADLQTAWQVLLQLTLFPLDPKSPTKGVAAVSAPGLNLQNVKILNYLRTLVANGSVVAIPLQVRVEDSLGVAKGWVGSKEQSAVFNRWFGGAWVDPESEFSDNVLLYSSSNTGEGILVIWLAAVAQNRIYPPQQLFGLAIKGVANPKRSDQFKKGITERFGEAVKKHWSATDRATAFRFVLAQVEAAPTLAERTAAARVLRLTGPLSDEQKLEIRNLIGRTREEGLAKALAETIQR